MMPLPILALLLHSAVAADIQVAPNGNDQNPGTVERPVAGLARAQALARERIDAGLEADLVIELAAGRYELSEPLRFGPGDGGDTGHAVVWRAADGVEATISGGTPVVGWRVAGRLWQATVPGVGEWYPRQLVVDGQPAQRARTPNGDAESGYLALTSGSLDEARTTYTVGVPPESLAEWSNLEDVEICWLGNWEITRKRLAAVDSATGLVTLQPPHGGSHDAMRPGPGRPFFFENAREFVDSPGEWYLDRQTRELTYFPREGETPATSTAVLAGLTRLVEVSGEQGRPVRNLRFEGLTFEDADLAFPECGINGIQASFYTAPYEGATGWGWAGWQCLEPALEWTWADGCSLRGCTLRNLGGVGLRVREGCHDNQIVGNRVEEIGASGLMLGECWTFMPWPENDLPAESVPTGNVIANNLVRRCGTMDYGAVGIWAAFCAETEIAHNHVYDLPYTGISVGFMWIETPTCARENHILANHVHNVLRVLCDGGCLYTLGFQPGSSIVGNWFHDAHRSPVAHGAPNNGIFFDQGSKGFHVEDNLIHGTSAEPLRYNLCAADWQTWGENHLGLISSTEGVVGRALSCDGAGGSIDAPDSTELDPPDLTVEAWIRLDGTAPADDPRRWVVNKNGNEWQAGHWALMIQGDRVGAYLNNVGGQDGMREAWSDDGALTPNAWHHVAMSYDGGDLVVYLDGAEVARAKIGEPRPRGGTPIAIGRRQDAYNYYRGDVDEVRLYDRALSADRIRARFTAAGRPVADGIEPVGWWGFEDLPGSEVLERFRQEAGIEQ